MTREAIIEEIKRTAAANGGRPFGKKRFFDATGLSATDLVRGGFAEYGTACREAGFVPNEFNQPAAPDDLLSRLATYVVQLGRMPTVNEMRVQAHSNLAFPHPGTFAKRFGTMQSLAARLGEFCRTRPEFENVLEICLVRKERGGRPTDEENPAQPNLGFVYLVKHGSRREYKIGKTNNMLRREGEIAIELPERVKPVHVIKTDDPAGIEAYWHRRFESKRKNGEWFELAAADVAAFKRWRRIA